MAPVKKQKVKNSPKQYKKKEKKEILQDDSVVSGQLQKKMDKRKKAAKDPKGVVFIKHLPHGFFEEQLKKYFEQFGKVTRLRLVRSRRTGASKGYAFVEFEFPEVAEVVAETMDNYLMFKQIVKATYIPPEKQQYNYFRTSVKRIRNKSGKLVWVSAKTAAIQQKVKKQNDWNEENYQKRTQKQLLKLKKIGKKYEHFGIDINEIILKPKVSSQKEKLKEKSEECTANKEKTISTSNAIKRRAKEDMSSNKQNSKKLKNKGCLEDLLGNTIEEDSEDEDYVPKSNGEDDVEQSDESLYGENYCFDNDQESENYEDQDDGENESKVEAFSIPKKKLKDSKKVLKKSGVDRFDEIIKRKPHSGGVIKINKKIKQHQVGDKKKTALKIAAAKELAKPLSKVKTKLSKPVKAKKCLNKVK